MVLNLHYFAAAVPHDNVITFLTFAVHSNFLRYCKSRIFITWTVSYLAFESLCMRDIFLLGKVQLHPNTGSSIVVCVSFSANWMVRSKSILDVQSAGDWQSARMMSPSNNCSCSTLHAYLPTIPVFPRLSRELTLRPVQVTRCPRISPEQTNHDFPD